MSVPAPTPYRPHPRLATVPNDGTTLSPEEYLRGEAHAEVKQDYVDGRRVPVHGYEYDESGAVVGMAGASRRHNRLVARLISAVEGHTAGGTCESYPSDMKVRIPATGRYYYPDIVVACGGPTFEDGREDVLLNPTLIVEVLSDSTETRDRGEKWQDYQSLPSLREYVLVSQDEESVERYVRQGEGSCLWLYSRTAGPDAVVTLESLGLEMRTRDLYAGILPAGE